MKTILVVDDEARIVSLVQAYLEKAGYQVVTARNGREAIYAARDAKPDLIILDIMMPEMDGQEFMQVHRQERQTPIIMLTAKIEEDDRIVGLELGADDYVTKPFSPRELMARVKAVLRRMENAEAPAETLRVRDVELDQVAYTVRVNQQGVDLTRTEFTLLALMMTTPGKAFSRLDLLEHVQGSLLEGSERTIDVHIKNLRTKIEPDPRRPSYIETVYGVGYRFALE